MSKKKKTINENKKTFPFWENFKSFIDHTEGLNKALISMVLINTLLKQEQQKLEDFIQKKAKKVTKDKEVTRYLVNRKDIGFHDKLRREISNSEIAYKVLPRSLFVGLVSQFDIFIASVAKIILDLHPDIISPDKTLSFKDIKSFKTIKEAVNHIIEKEIDNLLFDSHSAHLEWIGKKTGIDIESNFKDELPFFIELTERRNLLVHSDGIVNELYLTKCRKLGSVIDPNCKKGDTLYISHNYFKNSSECLYKIAFKITFLLWKKFVPKDTEEADVLFNNDIAVDLIEKKNYLLAEDILNFACNKFNDSNDQVKKLFLINLALAKKLDGRKEEAVDLVNNKDWSSCSNDFKLLVTVLNDNYSESFNLMRKIGKKGDLINEEVYRTVPIFNSLREHKDFPRVFKSIYKKDFESPEERYDTTPIKTNETKEI